MFRSRVFTILLFTALALLTSGCDKKTAEPGKETKTGKVMATVNGENILESDFENYLQMRQQQAAPTADKEKEKKLVLDEMINKTLLSQHAVSTKLDQDPEASKLMKRVREEILAQAVQRKLLRDNPITDDDVKKRFEQELENTHKTEYKTRHILVKEESQAQEILAQLQKGASFEKVAKEKSLDVQSGKNGGDLGWINQGMVVSEFFSAATGIKKGTISPAPVKSDFGWHIIKVDDTRPLKIPTFEEFMADQRSRANLYRKLQEERVGTFTKELKDKAKITVN